MRKIKDRKAYLFVSLLLFIFSFLHTTFFPTLYSLPYFSKLVSHLAPPPSFFTFCSSPFSNISFYLLLPSSFSSFLPSFLPTFLIFLTSSFSISTSFSPPYTTFSSSTFLVIHINIVSISSLIRAYNEINYIRQHYVFIYTYCCMFRPISRSSSGLRIRLSHWCCVHIGIPKCKQHQWLGLLFRPSQCVHSTKD